MPDIAFKTAQQTFARRVVVTCGPGYAVVDRVRRITNFSTGELGVRLTERLGRNACLVHCLKGEAATYRDAAAPAKTVHFSTNEDLLTRLAAVERREEISAFFHVAALPDYRVAAVRDADGTLRGEAKIPSRAGRLTIELEPAPKVIGELRALFPNARVVGWKYELDGTREQALARGEAQMREHGSAGCVVNGDAYGEGFAFLEPTQPPWHFDTRDELCEFLSDWCVGM